MSAISIPARLSGLPREAVLRLALKLDAAVTGANGLAYLLAAGLLDGPLGLSETLLRGVGVFFVAFAIALALIATRPALSRGAVGVVVGANLSWALGSITVAITGLGSPTTGGTVWIALQGLVVAGFAELQLYGLRRARA